MTKQNQSGNCFERRHNPDGMIDTGTDERCYQIRQRQTCRLEIPCQKEPYYGTGVLIGPDSILTNWHVVEKHDPSHGKIKAVFDYKTGGDGLCVLAPKTYPLASNCIIIHSTYPLRTKQNLDSPPNPDELDFVVLLIEEPVGRERGWCELSDEEHMFREGEPITILQHANSESLQRDTDSFKEWNENHTRVRYKANTEKGSSGSPCFDKRWKLVAIHSAGFNEHNEGIPVNLIRAYLEKSGIWPSLKTDEEQPDLFRMDQVRPVREEPGRIPLPDYEKFLPDRFFGREEDVRIVLEGLKKDRHFTLVGPGGIGKTAIAAETIRFLESSHSPLLKDGMVCHNFYKESSTEAMARNIVLRYEGTSEALNTPVESLKSLLARKRPFIYLEGCENAEDKELLEIRELIGSCPFLITTREKKQTVGLQYHEVDPIDPEAAIDLLCYHAGIESRDDVIESLCEALGHMPLAVELAGGWIKLNQSSPSELLKILENEGLSELHLGERQKRSIPLLLEKTTEHLSDTAKDIWAVLGLDAPQPVSISVIQNTLKLEDQELRKALGELMNACLLDRHDHLEYGIDDQPHYALKHQLIYTHGKIELGKRLCNDRIEAYARYYLSLLSKLDFSEGLHDYSQCSRLLIHFENSLSVFEKILGLKDIDVLASINALAVFHVRIGNYRFAHDLGRKALDSVKELVGYEHPLTLTCMNNLAAIFLHMKDYENALYILKKAFEVNINNHGFDSRSSLVCANNLVQAFIGVSEYEEAGLLVNKVINVSKRKFGLMDPLTLTGMNNSAILCFDMGNYDKSELLYRRVLKFRKKILGMDHPDTLGTMNNLAFLYYKKGDYEKAEKQFKLIIEKSGNILGENHPDRLTAIDNLASLYGDMRDYEQSIRIYENVSEIRKKVLGVDHPDTLVSVGNMRSLLKRIGRFYD